MCRDAVSETLFDNTGLEEETARKVFTGLVTVLKCALRSEITGDDMEHDLLAARCPAAFAVDMVGLVMAQKEGVSSRLDGFKAGLNRLSNVRWRVDVCISSASCSRVLRPVVLMELELSDGTIRTLEMSVEKFQELRYCTAQALKGMHGTESNPLYKVLEAASEQQRKANAARQSKQASA